MMGAEALVATLADCGVEACFANPGTSEMHLIVALDREPRIRSVLCLFEGVATGAADGYARIAGKPAATLLHLGPGYFNGAANLHNARRARVPLINIIGEHATHHRQHDAPLNSDIDAIIAPNSAWQHTIEDAQSAGSAGAQAYAQAMHLQGQASLVLCADAAWSEGASPAAPLPIPAHRPAVDYSRILAVADRLKAAAKPLVLLNGSALSAEGLAQAARLDALGVRIMQDTFSTRQRRGAGIFAPSRMIYFAEHAMADLAGVDTMILVETLKPVAFFAYPGKPSVLVPENCTLESLCAPGQDGVAALRDLADAMGAPMTGSAGPARKLANAAPTGQISPFTMGESLCRHMPQDSIVCDDAVSSGLGLVLSTQAAAPHDWLYHTGGAIGQGMPMAIGAAIAAPDRKIICPVGDGAGMYTVQALWTMAREQLDIVVIVCANGRYRILDVELDRTKAGSPGAIANSMLSLGTPNIDWAGLARAQGVEAIRVERAEAFDAALADAMARKGPYLIEAVM